MQIVAGFILILIGVAFADIAIKISKGEYDHWWENDDDE